MQDTPAVRAPEFPAGLEWVNTERPVTLQDLRGRFRWWGLYTQRKAGIDGGRTAVLEPHELEDEYFMLRVRIDGGALNLAQLRTIAEISSEFARDSAPRLRTGQETSQPNQMDVEYWATGLEPIYFEGAFGRAHPKL